MTHTGKTEKLKTFHLVTVLLIVCALVLGVLVSGLVTLTAVAADAIIDVGARNGVATRAQVRAMPTNPYFAIEDQYGVIWGTDTQVDIFKYQYENGDGKITVAGKNNRKVIAPGTENTYTFAIRNINEGNLDYKVIVEAWFTGLPGGVSIPVEVKLQGQEWLVGSEIEYRPVTEMAYVEESAVLYPYGHNIYTLQWRWPFEQDLNGDGNVDDGDALDTWLATQDSDVALSIRITTLSSYHLDDKLIPVPVPGLLDPFNHWSYLYGYEDGTIRPNDEITRAEVAAIFYRLLKTEIRDQYTGITCSYKDVDQSDWFYKEVSVLTALRILEGYPDGTFRGDETITRAEMAAILQRISQQELAKGNRSNFRDIDDHWAEQEIMAVEDYRWIEGRNEHTFAPDDLLTRAETAAMVNRMMHRLPESEEDLLPQDMILWPDNMDKEAWYWLDIQEASNYHEYIRLMGTREKWTRVLPVEPLNSAGKAQSTGEGQ